MCGILMICYKEGETSKAEDLASKLVKTLERRGPDVNGRIDIVLSSSWRASFYGYTLWLQGSSPTQQPLIDEYGNVLLWNGDVFYGQEDTRTTESDTITLSKKLQNADSIDEINLLMDSVIGPWSFVYYKKSLNVIITGRDYLGRHSLLWNVNPDLSLGEMLVLSSTILEGPFVEVPAASLFVIRFPDGPIIQTSLMRSYSINKQLPTEKDAAHWDSGSGKELYAQFEKVWGKELDTLEETLLQSVKVRVECQPRVCQTCVARKRIQSDLEEDQCPHSKVAILFSGGLDSAVLAALVDRIWPQQEQIDLLNVAFPCKVDPKQPMSKSYNVPDRLTGLQALDELRAMNPTRKWNFVEINVPLNELMELREERIAFLIHPSSTVLDDSIGCAQWFAARGKGHVINTLGEEKLYVSPARVVLMGAGADEQLGGYSRHRQRFANGGWPMLIEELEMEMKRIPQRNLGRDNRIIADHGRAPRLPYLDEKVVHFLSNLPVWIKTDLRLGLGVGDKIILRALAYRLGLIRTATEPKRAIQFGSRIAKAEGQKEKGSQMCQRLMKKS